MCRWLRTGLSCWGERRQFDGEYYFSDPPLQNGIDQEGSTTNLIPRKLRFNFAPSGNHSVEVALTHCSFFTGHNDADGRSTLDRIEES